MAYEVEIHHKAAQQIVKLPRRDQVRVAEKIETLADEPRPTGVEKLTDTRNGYRVRVGTYRIVYTVNDAVRVVSVVRVAHRRDVYRRL